MGGKPVLTVVQVAMCELIYDETRSAMDRKAELEMRARVGW